MNTAACRSDYSETVLPKRMGAFIIPPANKTPPFSHYSPVLRLNLIFMLFHAFRG